MKSVKQTICIVAGLPVLIWGIVNTMGLPKKVDSVYLDAAFDWACIKTL